MTYDIKNQFYIPEAIEKIVEIVGVREDIDKVKLLNLLQQKNIKQCVTEIANYLKLPINVNIIFVSKDYTKNNANRFETAQLSKTNSQGRATEGIVAQAIIPSNLPSYSNIANFVIDIKISENCLDMPNVFICTMAHELCHVLLHSLSFKEKDSEKFTDLTAMILGFCGIMKRWRKTYRSKVDTGVFQETTRTTITTYGYLSDEEFDAAVKKIRALIAKRYIVKEKTLETYLKLEKHLKDTKNTMEKYNRLIEYSNKNKGKKYWGNCVETLGRMYQTGYIEKLSLIISYSEKLVNEGTELCNKIKQYTNKNMKMLEVCKKEYDEIITKLKYEQSKIEEDINQLNKSVGLLNRLMNPGVFSSSKKSLSIR